MNPSPQEIPDLATQGVNLSWAGKRAPDITAVRTNVNVKTIEHTALSDHDPNLLIRGESLTVACALLNTFANRVKLIYLDPPYSVGADFDASLRTDRGSESVFVYADRWHSTEAYLQFLYERHILCRELLSDEGSIYLHVDQRTSHWARCILQEIFGRKHDRGTIVWNLGNGAKGRSAWSCVHNDILCFSKTEKFTFRHDQPSLREPYANTSIQSHFRHQDAQGRHYRTRMINGRTYHYYADHGRLIGSVWNDCSAMLSRSPILEESTGYPTQKPERLLERIIEASSNPDDIVADLFVGSGTTAAVAQRLGRRFIAADLGARAIETTATRLIASASATPLVIQAISSHEHEHSLALARLFSASARWNDSISAAFAETAVHSIVVFPVGVAPSNNAIELCHHLASSQKSCTILVSHTDPIEAISRSVEAHKSIFMYLPESSTAASVRSLLFSGVPQLHYSVQNDQHELHFSCPMFRYDYSKSCMTLMHVETQIARWFMHAADQSESPPLASGVNPGSRMQIPSTAIPCSPSLLTIIDTSGFRHRFIYDLHRPAPSSNKSTCTHQTMSTQTQDLAP